MQAEENKALVRRFYEAHAKGDFDAMREIMAADFADRSLRPDQEESDREAYLRGIAEDRAARSDIRFTIDDQVAEGDKIVEEWSASNIVDVVVPALEQEIHNRERIEQELHVARRIQHASLPKEVPELEGWE